MTAPGALAGIRILDLRNPGRPFATQLLGDLGADVIKVERPGVGDDARDYGPPFLGDPRQPRFRLHLSTNRNKRSITVDHSTPEGARLIRDLAAKSDVLVENFRTGVLAKYGLDHDSLRGDQSAAGVLLGHRFRPGRAVRRSRRIRRRVQAMCGLMSVSGIPDGEPGAGPMKVGVSMVDILTGLYTATAILAALRHRDAAGEASTSTCRCSTAGWRSLHYDARTIWCQGARTAARQRRLRRHPCRRRSPAPTARTSSWSPARRGSSRVWPGAPAGPELTDDPRFATVSARIANRDHVLRVLSAIFATEPREVWVRRLEDADVPFCSPVNSMPQVFANPQIVHREMLRHAPDRRSSWLRLFRCAIRSGLSQTPIHNTAARPTRRRHRLCTRRRSRRHHLRHRQTPAPPAYLNLHIL